MKSINEIKLVTLPTFKDTRGALTFFENNNHIPFNIDEIKIINNNSIISGTSQRDEFYVVLSGQYNINIVIEDTIKSFSITNQTQGILIPPSVGRSIEILDINTVGLIVYSK